MAISQPKMGTLARRPATASPEMIPMVAIDESGSANDSTGQPMRPNARRITLSAITCERILLGFAVLLAIVSTLSSVLLWYHLKAQMATLGGPVMLAGGAEISRPFLVKTLKALEKFNEKTAELREMLDKTNVFGRDGVRPFLAKTQLALQEVSEDTFGRLIWFKGTEQCLDSAPGSTYVHPIDSINCFANLTTAQWRISPTDGQIMVGVWHEYEHIKDLDSDVCLTCAHNEPFCDLTVEVCTEKTGQRFTVMMNAEQIQVGEGRAYFTINSQLYTTQCAGLYIKTGRPVFHLETCTGNTNQLFYLDIDYDVEFADKYRKLAGL